MTSRKDRPYILYVEDDLAIQHAVVEILEDAGFDLLVASDGTEALAKLETEKRLIDAVLTDVNLGRGPTGWNVARRARNRNARMPIIYASAVDEDQWLINGVPRSRFLAKPCGPSRIVDMLSSLLGTMDVPSDDATPAHNFFQRDHAAPGERRVANR